MPYKFETKKLLIKQENDKRRKLSNQQKDEIKELKGVYSQRVVASMFNVSRRTIVFIWYPERLEANKERRQERGGSKKYYEKETHKEYIKKHRRYKQELNLEGKLY